MARGHDQPGRGPVEGIGRGPTRPEAETPVARDERVSQVGRESAPKRPEQATPKGDQFRRAGALEAFLRRIAERIDRGFSHHLRLPRLTGDPSPTPFVTAAVRRFEKGEEQAKGTPDGRARFLEKTAAQWKAFFARFLHRAEKKRVPLDSVANAFTVRGVLKKGSDPATGVIISDFQLTDGTREKFARFDVQLAALLPAAATLRPGAAVPKEVVAQGLPSPELAYIAIGEARGESEIAVATRDPQGVFTNLKTEAAVAERLGLPTPGRGGGSETTAEDARATGPRGLGKWFQGGEELPEEVPHRFVPWWQWAREERLGLRRWFTAVTVALIVTLLGIGGWMLLRALV